MFWVFLAFVTFGKFKLISLSPDNILCFLEFLALNKVSSPGISNYISAVKIKLSMYGILVTSFSDSRLKYFNRSVARSANAKVTLKSIIDIPMLIKIAQATDFSFLRISNLVPHSISTFQP